MILKKGTALLLLVLAVFLFSSCSVQGEGNSLETGRYFENMTVLEYQDYILKTFYSLLPHLQSPEELGTHSIYYTFATDDNGPFPYDTLRGDNTSYYMELSRIPVFYGLLKEAAKYEESEGIDNSEAAAAHGKKHAIQAQSVEDMLHMLLRKEFPVTHGSADGAEYIESEQIYVYDELIDPHQPFIDKGWELGFCKDVYDNVTYKWGEMNFPLLECMPVWYDKEGNIYNLFGEFFRKQDDPSNRLITTGDYVKLRDEDPSRYVTDGYIRIFLQGDLLGNIQLSSKVSYVSIGTLYGAKY